MLGNTSNCEQWHSPWYWYWQHESSYRNNNAKTNKKIKMLLLEFVTLSGYKIDLVAVLNLFLCPEDFTWISSALQGKNAGETGWINTTKKLCAVLVNILKLWCKKKKKSADSEEVRRELETQTPLLLRREHIAHRTGPTCPPSLWIAITHNYSVLYQKLLDVSD